MSPVVLIALYCVLIVCASLFGGWLPSLVKLTHRRMQMAISFVGGLMLGVALYHLLPHAHISLDRAVWWTMIGLLTTFFMIRAFHFHEHAPLEEESGDLHEHGHRHEHEHHSSAARTSWIGVALGLALHTVIDGVAVAASVLAEAHGALTVGLIGLGTFIGVLLHKPLDSLSITSLMRAGGASQQSCQWVNAAYASMCPLGALLFYFGLAQFGTTQTVVVGCALAFAAGVFLCISLSDLLPELQFHTHDRFKLSLALILGVACAYGIRYLEPEGVHSHSDTHQAPAGHEHDHDHDHAGHEHQDK